jgi:hypothetical protein
MKRKGVYTYNDFITQFGGELKETDYLDRQILEAQIQKYYGYLHKARKNPAFNMVKETLDGVVQGFSQGNINIV